MNKIKKQLFSAASLLLALALSAGALAAERALVPLGRTTGVRLFAGGAAVIGFPEGADSPAQRAGVAVGDVVTAVDGEPVSSNEELSSRIAALERDDVVLTVRRGDETLDLSVDRLLSGESGWRLGVWVRDSMAGIGTITFVDPETGVFGALGHGVCDPDTGELMAVDSGAIMDSEVVGVVPGIAGSPGRLTGAFDTTHDDGTLYANTPFGLFGLLEDMSLLDGAEVMALAPLDEVVSGAAQIIANIAGREARRYDVLLNKTGSGGGRDFIVTVVDPALLEQTGGIVQGMSGSPILQDGRLVGAVTHVLVDDPARGYGIAIERMLAAAEEAARAS